MTNEEKMTPEEAIAEISFLKVAVNKVMEQALDMAINALSSWEEYSDKLWKEAYERGKTEALSQEPCDDAISRDAVLNLCTNDKYNMPYEYEDNKGMHRGYDEYRLINYYKLKQLPSVTQKSGKWIPVSERLPEDLEAVNITWVNHEPEPYYHDIKDKNFVATGIHYRGQWYWYSTTCADYLGEYGSNDIDKVDDAIEIVAWMPLPPSIQMAIV